MRTRSALLLFCAPLLAGCLGYREVELRAVHDIQVERFDAQGLALRVDVEVHNPNGYRIHVQDPDVDLFLNGRPAGRAELDSALVLEKRSTRRYSVPLHTRFTGGGLLLLLGSALGDELRVGATGTVTGRAGLLKRKVPFEVEETLTR